MNEIIDTVQRRLATKFVRRGLFTMGGRKGEVADRLALMREPNGAHGIGARQLGGLCEKAVVDLVDDFLEQYRTVMESR